MNNDIIQTFVFAFLGCFGCAGLLVSYMMNESNKRKAYYMARLNEACMMRVLLLNAPMPSQQSQEVK